MPSDALVPYRDWIPDDGVPPLPLINKPSPDDLQVQIGPGRILFQLYTSVGRCLESKANRLAHLSGLGPIAVTERIEKRFGDSLAMRQERLDMLFSNATGEACTQEDIIQIKKECQKLVHKYALPSEAVETQINTFNSMVLLSTRYPGLRQTFVECMRSRKTYPSSIPFEKVWMRPIEEHTPEWKFTLSLAVFCLSGITFAALLEGTKPSLLGGSTESDSGHVDLLLSQFYSPDDGPLKVLATRYLSGILEMPTFWEDPRYEIQCVAVKNLSRRAAELIQDTGIGSDDVENVPDQLASTDLDGIDLLADAILFGVESWIIRKRRLGDELRTHCWVDSFLGLIILLGSNEITEALPRSSRRAISTNWTAIKPPNIYGDHETEISVYSVSLYTQKEDKMHEEHKKGRERAENKGPEENRERNEELAGEEVFEQKEAYKPLQLVKSRGVFKPREGDEVIPIMGPSGVGKSTFINLIAGRSVVQVGHTLRSCTSTIQHVIFRHPTDPDRRIILVDTPGFSNTYVDDAEILDRIALWLVCSYHEMNITGIVYLHDICQARITGTASKSLDIFKGLVGEDAFANVVLGTIKWDNIRQEIGQQCEQNLRDSLWKDMIEHGSIVMRVGGAPSSARAIIDRILLNQAIESVLVQDEMVEQRIPIPKTTAGRMLRYTPDQFEALSSQMEDDAGEG